MRGPLKGIVLSDVTGRSYVRLKQDAGLSVSKLHSIQIGSQLGDSSQLSCDFILSLDFSSNSLALKTQLCLCGNCLTQGHFDQMRDVCLCCNWKSKPLGAPG